MSLFNNENSIVSRLEYTKELAHLSNDYLQALNPLILNLTAIESTRHELVRRLLEFIEESKTIIPLEQVQNLMEIADISLENLKESTGNYQSLIKFQSDMTEKTQTLIDSYGEAAK
jgi:hypothetical protein